MEPQSPPKRMTRARAAAKATGESSTTGTSTTASSRAKSATASSKARSSSSARSTSTATATTASAAAKRKLRSEDIETDTEQDELGLDRPMPAMQKIVRAVRGRPKKATTTEPVIEPEAAEAAPPARARGRPAKKTAVPEPPNEGARPSSRASSTVASAPRATRTKKTAVVTEDDAARDASDEPAKKRTNRARAVSASAATGTSTSSTTTRISVRTASASTVVPKPLATRKKVTFEEPEKENIIPQTAATTKSKIAVPKPAPEATATAGLKAKPVRRAAASAGTAATAAAPSRSRAASASGKSADKAAAPLSPKKVTQVRMARDFDANDSEDELGATDESHLKPFARSPTKPSLNVGMTPAERSKKLASAGLDLESSTRDITTNLASLPPLDFPGGMLASPARRPPQSPAKEGLMNSPARRLDGLVPLDGVMASTAKNTTTNGSSHHASVLFSPAKRFPVHPKNHAGSGLDDTLRSPLKMSLLQTPAKRPASPVKAALLLQRPDMKPSSLSAMASGAAIAEADEEEEVDDADEADEADVSEDDDDDNVAETNEKTESLTQMLSEMASEAATSQPESPTRRRFPGRLSAVLPRSADPSSGDPMEVDGAVTGAFSLRTKDLVAYDDSDDVDSDNDLTTRLPLSNNDDIPATPCPATKGGRGTKPTPSSRSTRASMGGQSTAKRPKMGTFGFTPLAEQLNGWEAHSPSKTEAMPTPAKEIAEDVTGLSPAMSESSATVPSFFDDAMAGRSLPSSPHHRSGTIEQPEGNSSSDDCAGLMDNVFIPAGVEMPEFDDDVAVTQEDLALAHEANDMSVMEPTELDDMINLPASGSEDDSMSEAGGGSSQEYGDENAIPIDPALLAQTSGPSSPGVPPVTPQRVMTRTFHTVSKVPLKPADESTPPPRPAMRRRSLSASKLPTSRRRSSISGGGSSNTTNNSSSPSKNSTDSGRGLTRSATVISYSPTKKEGGRRDSAAARRKSRRESFGGPAEVKKAIADSEDDEHLASSSVPPVTPTKSDMAWSTAGTPARTPRRDLDPALLRGAVVFVDVHTTEGADASAIFVELLSQMGARCVKSWPWNPCSPPEKEGSSSSSRIGITHVVFKDGSKRTLEKVRESGGVVQCVGVSWVLDCERENQWLDEAPYFIDTALVPRGGARRRKSMEPQALANMNGLLVSTPARQTSGSWSSSSARECRTEPRMSTGVPSTPMNSMGRRDSTLWMRTPEEDEGKHDSEHHARGGAGADAGADADGYGEPDWGMTALLTPVPKTPAPEAIARFAANITPSTPYGSDAGGGYYDYDNGGDDTLSSMQYGPYGDSNGGGGPLVTRTCPPKQRATSYHELGAGILSREKDEGVLMRLMAARRKSLQFAPKIASPLSKAWN